MTKALSHYPPLLIYILILAIVKRLDLRYDNNET